MAAILKPSTIDPRVFIGCVQESVNDTVYESMNFKPKQIFCMESIFLNQDTLAVLPTGYGKSVTFHLLPKLLLSRNRTFYPSAAQPPVVIVISPLNSLMQDQTQALKRSGFNATIVNAQKGDAVDDRDKDIFEMEKRNPWG